ncbi:8-oxo-dGTP diphosphatase [Candidatus Falkowbacteria bacterium]|nr:8-oxo-dGTP diphosphatase [Candidatus Falkowbacteria bacterium]
MKKVQTLCIVREPQRILLGMKKYGFGVGRWNGFGGKVEDGESVSAAAARELWEEAGIRPLDFAELGIIDFEFESDPKIIEAHIFCVTKFEGEISESNEMKPQWFGVSEIPFGKMWSDDEYWMSLFLEGKKFRGKFIFDRPSDAEYRSKIIEKNIHEVEEL